MKATLRAQRRAERERLEKKRRVVYHSDTVGTDEFGRVEFGKRLKRGEAKRRPERIDTATPCSCGMCGNPRRKAGELTLEEVKANRDFEQQLKEL